MNLCNLIIIILSIIICHGEQQYFIKEPEDITAIAGQKVNWCLISFYFFTTQFAGSFALQSRV